MSFLRSSFFLSTSFLFDCIVYYMARMGSNRIILLNQKGGVGKTTICVNLGSSLCAMGYKVLLVDFDSQGNLTGAVSGDSRRPTMYQVMTGAVSAEDAIQETPFQNLYLIPGSIDLAGLSIELADEDDRNYYLKKVLEGVDSQFDYVFVDCPPALGVLTMNAMAWADYIIIPMQCEYFAMEGLNLLMRTITNVKKSLNPDLRILGIAFNMFSGHNRLNAEVVNDTTNFFPDLVFKTIIPRSVRLAEAPSFGLPINVYNTAGKGTLAFANLAKEVSERVKQD